VAGHPCLESVAAAEALDAVDALVGARLEAAG
jgi:hypothetical protein